MRRDKTVIRRPRKTVGNWVAHCEQCDHLMYGRTFDAVAFNVRLHRRWTQHPPRLPRRAPGLSLWREVPLADQETLIGPCRVRQLVRVGARRGNLAASFGHRRS